MVIVDEVRKTVIDALMVWHMRVRRMNAHRFSHDLRQRPTAAQQFVVNAAAALLIASQQPFFEFVIQVSRLLAAIFARRGLRCHRFFTPRVAIVIELY
jgi:hypothetical protein